MRTRRDIVLLFNLSEGGGEGELLKNKLTCEDNLTVLYNVVNVKEDACTLQSPRH